MGYLLYPYPNNDMWLNTGRFGKNPHWMWPTSDHLFDTFYGGPSTNPWPTIRKSYLNQLRHHPLWTFPWGLLGDHWGIATSYNLHKENVRARPHSTTHANNCSTMALPPSRPHGLTYHPYCQPHGTTPHIYPWTWWAKDPIFFPKKT